MTSTSHLNELLTELLTQKEALDQASRAARADKAGRPAEMRVMARQLQTEIEKVHAAIQEQQNATARKDLPPCPFCGSLAILSSLVNKHQQTMWFVICADTRCGCALRRVRHPGMAIKIWCERAKPVTVTKP